jgi:NADPH:quinone reductase-like Zn-dependent oxidoreductase
MKVKRVIGWSAAGIAAAVLLLILIAYVRSTNSCYDGTAKAPTSPMKAVIYCDYGSADVLEIEQVEKPVPSDSQVLVRVRAASVNPLDWHFMRGEPLIARPSFGMRKPAVIRLGVDFAGVVEAVGKDVTQFKPGDEVFSGRTGAFAQYVTIRESQLAKKPANLTFEETAAIPVAAITALQGLRDKGGIQPGQKVLINGASGGVGTFAVQIAKSFGANVTGVCSTRNVEMVRSLGADQVIDYTKEDFTKSGQQYDLVLDNVGNHSLSTLRGVLKPNGIYIMVGGPKGKWIDPMPRVFQAMLISKFGKHDMRFFISELNQKDLQLLADLIQTGKVRPVIDRTYKFSDIREAVRYQEAGHARGKVVVTVD